MGSWGIQHDQDVRRLNLAGAQAAHFVQQLGGYDRRVDELDLQVSDARAAATKYQQEARTYYTEGVKIREAYLQNEHALAQLSQIGSQAQEHCAYFQHGEQFYKTRAEEYAASLRAQTENMEQLRSLAAKSGSIDAVGGGTS